jgi:hypothetical protein
VKVEFGCPECAHAVEAAPGETASCSHCGHEAALPGAESLDRCLACGCEELYRHRDFNQKLGIFLIALGVFLWWLLKSFWPMVIAAAIDLALFKLLPDVGICYRCKAHHRSFEAIRGLPAFDLERHEHYRFVNSKES